MKGYKLIQEYPGSPELGYIIPGISSEMFSIKPHLYPHLWERFESSLSDKLYDGSIASIGDKVWCINDKSNMNTNLKVLTEFDFPFTRTYFKTQEEAIYFRDLQITIITEDGAVIGENIPIYSLLTKSNWEESETSSLQLYRRRLIETRPLSDSWKYFKTKEFREEYIKNNKPLYSKNDIIDLLSTTEDLDVWDIINNL